MGKRVVISLIAIMSLGAIWWTGAEAGPTCLKWITAGGSGMCAAWSTKGVQVELNFKQDCGPDGVSCQAIARASAGDGNAVALCQLGDNGPVTPKECIGSVNFVGSTIPAVGCEPSFRHEQDIYGTGGAGHDKDRHGDGCKATIILLPDGPPACTQCGNVCDAATEGVCKDVTPFEMKTTVEATNAFVPPLDPELTAAAQGGSACTGAFCTFEQHCSINPKKITLIEVTDSTPPGAPYQCNLTCVGDECFPEEDGG